MENQPIEFYYWRLRGLGSQILNLMEYAGVKYNCNYFDIPEASKYMEFKANEIKNGFTLMNLPSINDNGNKVAESGAVMFYIANTYCKELVPSCMSEMTKVLTLQGVMKDFIDSTIKPVFQDKELESFKTNMKQALGKMQYKIQYFKEILSSNEWALGKDLSFVDFSLAELFEKFVTLQEELKEEFFDKETLEVFQNYVKKFTSLPKIKEYRESERYLKRPFHPESTVWY
uniref:glutathione transferase n=1 Tax=Lepeophtheirus salmonis TaxID=72036 RepID=D3PJ41_LEPSM|nr:Glutathione S-transferase Mu 2 [Lepeophtheirus salmonis]